MWLKPQDQLPQDTASGGHELISDPTSQEGRTLGWEREKRPQRALGDMVVGQDPGRKSGGLS
jgi:hypothetical protein